MITYMFEKLEASLKQNISQFRFRQVLLICVVFVKYSVCSSLLSTRNTVIQAHFFPRVINLRGLGWESQTVK